MNSKLLLTLSAILFLQFSANSQAEAGVLTGINYSTHYFKSDLDFIAVRPRMDYFGGLAFQYALNNKWRLASNVLYSREGYNNEQKGVFESYNYRFSYIYLLSEAEYRLFPFLSLGAGTGVSFLTNTDVNLSNSGWEDGNKFEFIKKTDFRLTGKIKLEYRGFYTFARYNLGVRDISDITYTDGSGNTITNKQFTRNMQFGLGYMITLGKS